MGSWRIRYFVLTIISTGTGQDFLRLCYYTHHSGYEQQPPKGEVPLLDIKTSRVARVSRVLDHQYHKICSINTTDRTYYFAVKTENIMTMLFDCLKRYLPECISNEVTFVRGVNLSRKLVSVSEIPDDPSDIPVVDVTAASKESSSRRRKAFGQMRSQTLPSPQVKEGLAGSTLDMSSGSRPLPSTASSGTLRSLLPVSPEKSRTASVAQPQSKRIDSLKLSKRHLAVPQPDQTSRSRASTSLIRSSPVQQRPSPTRDEPMLLSVGEIEQNKARLKTLATVVPLSSMDTNAICRLGHGNFGSVYEVANKSRLATGRAEEPVPDTVAVKKLKSKHSLIELNQFLQEAIIMARMDHAHVVKLLGVQIDATPFCMIMEVMNEGDLKTFLTDCKEAGDTLPYAVKLWIIFQVATGMNYISEKKGILHRDLAARNVLLCRTSDDEVIAKISDFGLAKSSAEYVLLTMRTLPVKWLSVEVLRDGIYSFKSDVWAFGVMLWETLTDGAVPYTGIPNSEVYYKLLGGMQLERPAVASDMIVSMMHACMSLEPDKRPCFAEICVRLGDHIKMLTADPVVDKQVEGCLEDVVQIYSKGKTGQPLEDDTDEGGYTPMLPATLTATATDLVTPEWVDSLGVADLQRFLLRYTGRQLVTHPEFQSDINWLRARLWSLVAATQKDTVESPASEAAASSSSPPPLPKDS
eukprot:scpid36281/ scgid3079/ Tyrosine-protein kinase transforming protein Abl; V-abl